MQSGEKQALSQIHNMYCSYVGFRYIVDTGIMNKHVLRVDIYTEYYQFVNVSMMNNIFQQSTTET